MRYTFGGTTADFVFSTRDLIGSRFIATTPARLTFWSAKTGGTRYTDLLVGGVAASTVTTTPDGLIPQFDGPDGVTQMWVDAGAGERMFFQFTPADAVTAAGVEANRAALARSGAEAARRAAEQLVITPLDLPDGQTSALIMAESTRTRAALNAAYAPRTLIPATRAQAWGHSFMAGVGWGVDADTEGMAVLTSDALGLPLAQHAVGGTALFSHQSADSNWTSIARDVRRPTTFDELGGFYPVMYGMNDVAQLGLTEAALLPYKHALRFALSRMRSGAVFADDHSSVVYTGHWQGAAGFPFPGGHISYSAETNARVTITTPEEFPGGYVVPVFMVWAVPGAGAVLTGSGNASGYDVDTRSIGRADSRCVAVTRVPAAPGAGTYTWTVSNASDSVGAIFAGWQWEPVETGGPLVALVQQAKPLDYDGYTGAPYKPTDASIDFLNAAHAAIAEEFGRRVVLVDTSELDKAEGMWVPGNVHPTAGGHARFAELIVDTVRRSAAFVSTPLDVPKITSGVSPGGGPAWTPYVPTISGTGSAKGNGSTVGAYLHREDGTVDFYAQFILGSTSTIGSTPGAPVRISLPVPALSELAYVSLTGLAQDAGTGFKAMSARMIGTGDVAPLTSTGDDVTGSTPIVWTTNDVIEVRGTYRIA